MSAGFAQTLRAAMRERGVTIRGLAEASGVGMSVIRAARAGRHVPLQESVAALSDVLMWPSLVTVALERRTAVCDLCGGTFVRGRRQDALAYCTARCARTAHARRQRTANRKASASDLRLSKTRLALHQSAVLAMCRGCEPEGVCRTPDCALRGVSPLPLMTLRRSLRSAGPEISP